MPKTMRLTEKHSTSKKLDQVFELMDKLGISIIYGAYGRVFLHDTEFPEVEFELKDSDYGSEGPDAVPPTMEFKIIYEDDSEDRAQEVVDV